MTRPYAVRINDLVFHGGEIVGVAAIEGNGQRRLLRSIAGVEPRAAGITVTGTVAFVPEDRTTEALIADFSLSANLLLGRLRSASRWIDWNELGTETTAIIERHDVRATGPGAAASSLSGGNQQKFILARALEAGPDILVVEEPTRGLDLHATAVVREALRAAAAGGACVLVHSSDLDEVLELADRLLVMVDGRVTELPGDTARDTVGDAMLGLV
ncbi:MAG TPA: ATP-binding cassette domain-containing protein [Gemmatimonadales bacterium]|nr:ATP-binding cassette domain-containing protein [Gemmatimonadales bacterium]